MKIYKDDYGNTAKIERVKIFPYKGASCKSTGYRLLVTSDYENDFLYYVSVYETLAIAKAGLNKLSAGTFEEVKK